MEEYLKKEYKVLESPLYLKEEKDIIPYFVEAGADYLDCGQGYYQDDVTKWAMTADEKFWNVRIQAEIESSKQDHGDRLYWVERIKSVDYRPIDKPKKMKRRSCAFQLMLTEFELSRVEALLNEMQGN